MRFPPLTSRNTRDVTNGKSDFFSRHRAIDSDNAITKDRPRLKITTKLNATIVLLHSAIIKTHSSELLLLEYVVKHMSLPYTFVVCRFDRISITQYNGRCQKLVVYIFVVRRGAPPSNCDIRKAIWREYYSENGGLRKRC